MPRFHKRFQFQPKANVPMVTETRDRLALEIRMAGETLISEPTIDTYNTLSKMFAALNRAGLAAVVDPGSLTMNAICDRYEKTRSVTVEPEEPRSCGRSSRTSMPPYTGCHYSASPRRWPR